MRGPAPATASTARRVSVATPHSRCRKLSATRSPASSVTAGARTRTSTAPGSTHAPSSRRGATDSRQASRSSSAYTRPTIGRPATTKRPSATNAAAAARPAAAPSSRVVTSSRARSSSRARRTSARPSGSANRQHPIDGAPRPRRDVGGHGDLGAHVPQAVAQLLERDQLHEAALGRFGQRVELLLRVLTPQAVQHTGLRGHDEAAGERGARPYGRSEEHTSELQSRSDVVCRLLLEKKK